MNNFLPSKGELKRRHMSKVVHCETCGKPGESLFHVAFKCSFAVRFCRAAREVTGCEIPVLHPVTWTWDLLAGVRYLEKDTSLIICGVWSLWSGRNARKYGKEKWNATAAIKHVAAMVDEQRWRKPDPGWFKVNTDAAFQASTSSGTGGAVIRDGDRRLVAAAAKSYMHVVDVLTAEAMADREGLNLAVSRGCEQVVLEVDNLPLFNLLQCDRGERSVIPGLWQEIRELSRIFNAFKLSFVYREGNEAAHMSASLASVTNPNEL